MINPDSLIWIKPRHGNHAKRSAPIGRVRPLRHDALQPHAADMIEHGWAVTRQVFGEPDGAPLGPRRPGTWPQRAVNTQRRL